MKEEEEVETETVIRKRNHPRANTEWIREVTSNDTPRPGILGGIMMIGITKQSRTVEGITEEIRMV